jgi:hypothetical protein
MFCFADKVITLGDKGLFDVAGRAIVVHEKVTHFRIYSTFFLTCYLHKNQQLSAYKSNWVELPYKDCAVMYKRQRPRLYYMVVNFNNAIWLPHAVFTE